MKTLIIVTSHKELGSTGKTTGYYLSEVTHPVYELQKADFDVDIASPQGGPAPMDENSRDMSDPLNRDYMGRADFIEKIENTIPLSEINPNDYRAVVLAGGHGTMWDFPDNTELQRVVSSIYQSGGVVAAVCHGPAGLVNIKLDDGTYLIADKTLTGFTNDEESASGLTSVMPFLLEDALKAKGARYHKAGLWQKNIAIDGRLVTGQNPASAQTLGEAVAHLLRELQ